MYLKYLENHLRRLADELLAVSLFSGGDGKILEGDP